MYDDEFADIITQFIESSKELADAAALCADDPIKQEMVMFIQEQFSAMRARSEGIKLLVVKDYVDNREFVFEEMKQVSKSNYEMATQIRNVLEGLE